MCLAINTANKIGILEYCLKPLFFVYCNYSVQIGFLVLVVILLVVGIILIIVFTVGDDGKNGSNPGGLGQIGS